MWRCLGVLLVAAVAGCGTATAPLSVSRRAILLFALGLAAASAAAAQGQSRGAVPCGVSGARVAAASSQVVIAIRKRKVASGELVEAYGCTYRSQRRLRIYRCRSEFCFVYAVRAAGGYGAIAVGDATRYPGSGQTMVLAADPRRGTVVRRARATPSAPEGITGTRVTDLELKPNGAVAWILAVGRVTDGKTSLTYEVHKADTRGPAELDASSDIDAHSLALSESRLYWTKAGGVQTALLD